MPKDTEKAGKNAISAKPGAEGVERIAKTRHNLDPRPDSTDSMHYLRLSLSTVIESMEKNRQAWKKRKKVES